jgi:hypothetical protein
MDLGFLCYLLFRFFLANANFRRAPFLPPADCSPRRIRPRQGEADQRFATANPSFGGSEGRVEANAQHRTSNAEQMLSASLIRENEKPGIASRVLLFDRAPDGGWRTICLFAKRRRRSAVGAKCASHFHPQKPPALCAGH